MNFWVLELKWHTKDYEVHSLHRFRESAVGMGQEVFDSLAYDRKGDGVRLRRGIIGKGGLTIAPKVHWARYCKVRILQDAIMPLVQEDEDEEGDQEYIDIPYPDSDLYTLYD